MFEPVVFNWKGRDFTIPSDRVMGAIFTVEEIITLQEMAEIQQTKRVNISKISKAYAAVLRYAGADVTHEETYLAMFGKDQNRAISAVQTLLFMMIPPNSLTSPTPVGAAPTGKNRAERRSSPKPTRRRSA